MANKRRGYYTTNLGGRERTLHFSMNFWANFTEIMEVPLDKIGDLFSGGVSIFDVSLIPINDCSKVLGIGVAVKVSL